MDNLDKSILKNQNLLELMAKKNSMIKELEDHIEQWEFNESEELFLLAEGSYNDEGILDLEEILI